MSRKAAVPPVMVAKSNITLKLSDDVIEALKRVSFERKLAGLPVAGMSDVAEAILRDHLHEFEAKKGDRS